MFSRQNLVVAFLFLLGFLFRIWFIHLVPQPVIVFDQKEYHNVAVGMLDYGFYVAPYRTYGFPLIVSTLYRFFGQNQSVWQIFQSLIDTLTGTLVFFIGLSVFRRKTPSWIAYALYIFNPFSSAYAGVLFTEITAIFLITLITFLFVKVMEKKNLLFFFYLGLALGFLPHVRPGFIYWTMVVLICAIILALKGLRTYKTRIFTVILLLFYYFIPFIYSVVGNLKYYHQFALLTVDNLFVRELYLSFYIDRPINTKDYYYPPVVQWTYATYTAAWTKEEREAMQKRFLGYTFDKIKENPTAFLISRVKKFWLVWEKHMIYPYVQPPYKKLSPLVYWTNIALLVAAAFGVFIFTKKKTAKFPVNRRAFSHYFLFLVIYISVAHAFTITEERFSLPAYPLILLFTGLTAGQLISKVSEKAKKLFSPV